MFKFNWFNRLKKNSKNSFLKVVPFDKLNIEKRQRFIIVVGILSFGLYISENLLGKSGFLIVFILSVLTNILLYLSNREDIKNNFSWNFFVLPFFYSLSFGLSYFLVPDRFLTRVVITSFYAVGLYSLFLCENIFTVASIRTIALLSSARTVSFILTFFTYCLLAFVVFSLDFSVFFTSLMVFIFSFFLISYSIWTYTLEKPFFSKYQWSLILSLVLSEISFVLWFWPSHPILIGLFLGGFFYSIVGLMHVWIEKRLFRGVLWEYVWLSVFVFCILILFTSWKGTF